MPGMDDLPELRRGVTLPRGVMPRGLTREQAAAFFGVSVASFAKGRMNQKFPGPTLPGGRYDRVLLEQAADALSGILPAHADAPALSAYETWKAARHG